MRRIWKTAWTGWVITAGMTATAVATVDDLRITEVNPTTDQVEITHTGTQAFTVPADVRLCYSFSYNTAIASGTPVNPGQVFTVNALSLIHI